MPLLVAACGSSGEVPNADDKERITTASLLIAAKCIGRNADESDVEDSATTLLEEAEEAGDKRFTLSDKLADVTMADILRRNVQLMRRYKCAAGQAERLEDAAD